MSPLKTIWIWRWVRFAVLGEGWEHVDEEVERGAPPTVERGGREARGEGHPGHGQVGVADARQQIEGGPSDGLVGRRAPRPSGAERLHVDLHHGVGLLTL